MGKIKVLSVGKSREAWLKEALSEYEKRLPSKVEWHIYNSDKDLENAALKCRDYIALDPKGTPHTSESFAEFVNHQANLTFIIGSAEGLTPQLKGGASHTISFSNLTFTHQMTRLILIEQLYRASQIQKQTRYHK